MQSSSPLSTSVSCIYPLDSIKPRTFGLRKCALDFWCFPNIMNAMLIAVLISSLLHTTEILLQISLMEVAQHWQLRRNPWRKGMARESQIWLVHGTRAMNGYEPGWLRYATACLTERSTHPACSCNPSRGCPQKRCQSRPHDSENVSRLQHNERHVHELVSIPPSQTRSSPVSQASATVEATLKSTHPWQA